jgi:phenylacetate-CoA ligase
MTLRAWDGLRRVLEHPHAPRYNRTMGDRVGEAELAALEGFRRALRELPKEHAWAPSGAICDWIEGLRGRLYALDALPRGFDARRDFDELPTTSRDDLAQRLVDWVPRDLELDPAIVYSTSATTGHAVIIPSHPTAMTPNLAHLEALAELHGVALAPEEGVPFATNLSCQRRTYVFATTMSGWAGAVFAKLNLAEHDWAGGAASREAFVRELAPAFVSSEPKSLSEALRLELPFRPRMVVSSAVRLEPRFATELGRAWGAAVVDLYSTTETGPIAATVPGIDGHVVLVPDLFVECVDARGERVRDGERGEIAVTGGRNPYLPLVRYRTGDHGRLTTTTLPDGRYVRVIRDLEGRAPIAFVAEDGGVVGSVDIARRIRPLAPFVQHALHQRADRSVELRLRPLPNVPIPIGDFEHALRELFGRGARVEVIVDPELGRLDGKLVAWRCDCG